MKNKKEIGIVLVLLSVVFAGTNLYAKESENKVRIGFFPNILHAQALIGKENGEFARELGNVKIEWKEFNAGSAEIEAFMAGEVDIGYIGPGPAVNGYAKTRGELQIIAGAANAGAIFVVGRNSKITKISDLSGKKVAIPQYGNTQDLSLRNILKKNNLKETIKGGTVEIVQAENPDIKVLLDNNNIDAALVPEPWGARLIKEVGAKVLLNEKEIWRNGDYSTAVIIVKREFAEKNPLIIEKFLKTHVELTEFINKDRKKAEEYINRQIKTLTGKNLPADVLEAGFARVVITYDPVSESISEIVKLSAAAGFLRSEPDLKELFNFNSINKVLKSKGLKNINDR